VPSAFIIVVLFACHAAKNAWARPSGVAAPGAVVVAEGRVVVVLDTTVVVVLDATVVVVVVFFGLLELPHAAVASPTIARTPNNRRCARVMFAA
jgi:hypothetical protein